MWLAHDLAGINLNIRVRDYTKSANEDWYTEWCQVDLTLQSGNWLHYCMATENLLCCEVEESRDTILDFLQNKRDKPENLSFIEPDLSFHIHPFGFTGYSSMDLHVHLWDEGLPENYISVGFDRDDMEKFCSYLQFITGAITREHEIVQQLLEEKIFQSDE